MEIKIISFNIHKGIGWPTRKSTINEIAQQINLLNPDVIFFQEIKGDQFKLFINEQWTHQSYGKNAVTSKGDHGNAILSKYPINFAKNIDLSLNHRERRGLLHVITHIPEYHQALHLLCVHLGLFKNDRHKQLLTIRNYIKNNVPNEEALILGGDFNDWGNHAKLHLIEELQLNEVFLSLHGEYAKTFPAWAPVLKLDRIYYRKMEVKKAYRIIQTPWKSLSDHIAIHACLKL